jgi:hypothetical protein
VEDSTNVLMKECANVAMGKYANEAIRQCVDLISDGL